MLFTSLQFALFLFICFIIYWAVPERFRRIVLLAASCGFYISWGFGCFVMLCASILLSYFLALAVENCSSTRQRKLVLSIACILSLLPLMMFKYFNFFSETAAAILSLFSIELQPARLSLIMPVGISFYTFQMIGYLVDVYRKKVPAERNFLTYMLFVSFFPQIISGPIARGSELIPQLKTSRSFDYGSAAYGLKLMVWGFFKKMVIADQLAVFVDAVYKNLSDFSGGALLLAVFFFSIQIYCDFSGYTDIAVGCARLFGIELCRNFASPYFSPTIREFWSRWHISLSTWFRDYLYFPLGGSRAGLFRTCLNIFITFLVSGLWHGASWTFIVWGSAHGLVQIIERLLHIEKCAGKTGAVYWLRTVCVFILVSLIWVFFRADTFEDAMYVFAGMFNGLSSPALYFASCADVLHETLKLSMKILVLSLVMLTAYDYASLKTDVITAIGRWAPAARYGIYLAVCILTLLFHSPGSVSFIYFQF